MNDQSIQRFRFYYIKNLSEGKYASISLVKNENTEKPEKEKSLVFLSLLEEPSPYLFEENMAEFLTNQYPAQLTKELRYII